jgi:hypothetical protein
MKLILSLITIIIFSLDVHSDDNTGYESIGNGFSATYVRDDPFDETKKRYTRMSKRDFYFNCEQISFKTTNGLYSEHSLSAEIALKIDENEPFRSQGKFSSGMFGKRWVTDSNYFTVWLSENSQIIQELKSGNTLVASGKWRDDGGWSSPKKMSLIGFTDAFEKLCNQVR